MLKKILLVALLLLASPCAAQQLEDGWHLEGIGAVAVMSEDMTDEALKAGLTPEKIEQAVKLRLGIFGVPVTDEVKGHPVLYLNVNVMPVCRTMVVSVSVELKEKVYLNRRDEDAFKIASTWTYQSLLILADVKDARPIINGAVTEFAGLYMKVNPANPVRRN